MEFETAEGQCPVCKTILDAATNARGENKMPSPGDISICFYCVSLLVFEKGLTVREATLEEVSALDDQSRNLLLRLRMAAIEAHPLVYQDILKAPED